MNLEEKEYLKRDRELCLIASENYPSEDVLKASGSIFQLKYSEGFPYKRYYAGTEVVDEMEDLCIKKCLELFDAEEEYNANVQPNSGASANMIVYNAILEPNDTVLAMDVKAGGHISHSHPKSFISKYHNVVTYGVDDQGLLDYDEIERIALATRPKLIICGASNYSREVNFRRFAEIRDKVKSLGTDCYLLADIAHISVLVAHGLHCTPVGLADFITSTTHKSLRGPRGAFILYKKKYDKQIRLSTIPGLFGGPLEHQIYAKLVCFNEMLKPEAKIYSKNIIKNSKAMFDTFMNNGLKIVSNSTQNHLMTIDLTDYHVTGKEMSEILEECGVITNCNTVPNDKRSFLQTSGIRVGVPAITARGFSTSDTILLSMRIAGLIIFYKEDAYEKQREEMKQLLKATVKILTKQHPLSSIYPELASKIEEKVLTKV